MNEPPADHDSQVTLLSLWEVFCRQFWVICGIGGAAVAISVVVALVLPPIYRSDAVVAPVSRSESAGILDRFSGLANIAGVSLPQGDESAKNLAIFRSKAFAANFISDLNLMPVFFADQWDEQRNNWADENSQDIPTIVDAVRYFHENVFTVQQDTATGMVRVSVEWKSPEQAADWVNDLVARVNRETRQRAIDEVNRNLNYLRGQLENTNVVELKLALSRLIEVEMKKAMYAMGSEEYAFEVLDPGQVPTERTSPRRTLIVILGAFVGGILAVIIALLIENLQRQLASRRAAGSSY